MQSSGEDDPSADAGAGVAGAAVASTRPLRPGDVVQATDPKGHRHTLVLEEGRIFHTHRGGIAHDDLIGRPEGIVVASAGGTPYVILRSHLEDFTLGMPRGAAVIYPKDSGRIVTMAGLRPGARVLEAGAGSGALTCALITAVGPTGTVSSWERRPDFANTASANVSTWFTELPPTWSLTVGDIVEAGASTLPRAAFDAAILDLLNPWDCLDAVGGALRPGGALVVYVATTTQLSRIAEALREDGRWTEPRAEELIVRTWHLDGLAVRPDHRMIGHTGFLLASRRLADGTVLPPRRRRPAKGAYGEDYQPGAM